jgi:hypothetical protein
MNPGHLPGHAGLGIPAGSHQLPPPPLDLCITPFAVAVTSLAKESASWMHEAMCRG